MKLTRDLKANTWKRKREGGEKREMLQQDRVKSPTRMEINVIRNKRGGENKPEV